MAILTACVSNSLFEGLTPGSFRTLAELLSWPSTSHGHKALGSYSLVVSKLPGFLPSGGGGGCLRFHFIAKAQWSVYGN